MTRQATLSQSFDVGDFISPDILSIIDAGVRADAAGILIRERLVDDISRIIDLHADVPIIYDPLYEGLVPSMNPDKFLHYDLPETPVIAGFDMTKKSEDEMELKLEEAVLLDPVDVNISMPDLGTIEKTATMMQEDIVIDMPEISRFNANLFKVKLDTLRFDKKFTKRVQLFIAIIIIAAIEFVLILYLLNQ